MTNYLVYDVFTDTPFGGNQLAVIPDATNLAEDDLLKITQEFNFSETTFVYPPTDPAHTARVRIFTPTTEVPFAGHPTIGTAVALHDLGQDDHMILELGIGPIPCEVNGKSAAFTTSAKLERIAHPDPSLVAASLGLRPQQIMQTAHVPVQASLGLPFVITELDSPESLAACEPDTTQIKQGATQYPAGLDFALYAYVRQGNSVEARMFAPLDNIPEDPATGSAAATLAALLSEELGKPQSLTITQGVTMGRPSTIHAETGVDGVTISGQAVKTMEGRLVL